MVKIEAQVWKGRSRQIWQCSTIQVQRLSDRQTALMVLGGLAAHHLAMAALDHGSADPCCLVLLGLQCCIQHLLLILLAQLK